MALQTIVSREIRPLDPAVVTVGSIHGGSKHNIIPDEVTMQLTSRSYDPAVRGLILASVRRMARGIALAAGVPEECLPVVAVAEGSAHSTYNSPDLARRIVPVWRRELGAANVVERDPEMGFEDFSEYGMVEPRIPGFLFRLGAAAPERVEEARRGGKPLPGLHSSEFLPDSPPTIATGVKAMATAALELLR